MKSFLSELDFCLEIFSVSVGQFFQHRQISKRAFGFVGSKLEVFHRDFCRFCVGYYTAAKCLFITRIKTFIIHTVKNPFS